MKAQVLVGGRGKAGGVKLAGIAAEAEPSPRRSSAWRSRASRSARSWSAGGGHRQGVLPVRASSIAPAPDPAHGLRGGRRRDRAGRGRATRSRSSRSTPIRCSGSWTGRRASWRSGWASAATSRPRSPIAKGLVRTMLANDADLVEINPLAVVSERAPTARRRPARLPRRQDHPRRFGAGATPGPRGPARP